MRGSHREGWCGSCRANSSHWAVTPRYTLSTGASSACRRQYNWRRLRFCKLFCQSNQSAGLAHDQHRISHPTLRADAQRNRDNLLSAATRAFAEEGEDVPLESIAARAGVGIGTLYRHFSSREALVCAAYCNEVDALCGAAADLLRTLPADQALRAWAERFADYIAAKRAMGDALRS